MEKISKPVKAEQTSGRPQVLYIDGCKVTVRYSGQGNPAAVKNIKNTLLSSSTVKKN